MGAYHAPLKKGGLFLHPLHWVDPMTSWTNGMVETVSALHVALSQPGNISFPPLRTSCHVRRVALLRPPDNVPHGERESQGTEKGIRQDMKRSSWK